MNKYYEIFKRNFPFIVRNKDKTLDIINNPNNKIIEVNDNGQLIGVSIIYKDTLRLLCVDKEYRNRGIGSILLGESEKYVLDQGYDSIKVEDNDNYIMPGVPMRSKIYDKNSNDNCLYDNVDDSAYHFFVNRGYNHGWKEDNCFDMRADLDKVEFPSYSIGDTINGITYRFATIEDIPKIVKCTDDADSDFTKYYQDEKLYDKNNKKRVLIAIKDEDVCGTLIISIEDEGKDLGSVGCTAVSHNYRGKHIGVNMVILGTKYLKSIGLKKGYLGYTYSGLDKMYGYAGYKICLYYFMAEKQLVLDKRRNYGK